jgi:hypothetical protein
VVREWWWWGSGGGEGEAMGSGGEEG